MGMSDEEYQQAESALTAERNRRALEQAAAQAERLAPLAAITASDGFAGVKSAIAALPLDLVADEQIGPCITAIRKGMEGLLHFAPVPVSAPAAPTA